jgi:hypothetical protein
MNARVAYTGARILALQQANPEPPGSGQAIHTCAIA